MPTDKTVPEQSANTVSFSDLTALEAAELAKLLEEKLGEAARRPPVQLVPKDHLESEDVFNKEYSIEELQTFAFVTEFGEEKFTRNLPNVSEQDLKNIDEFGFVRIGTKVKAGDLLVGKVTPRNPTEVSQEDRLLKVIFGELSSGFRDTSLRVPPGYEGTILSVRHFDRSEKSNNVKHGVKVIIKRTLNQKIESEGYGILIDGIFVSKIAAVKELQNVTGFSVQKTYGIVTTLPVFIGGKLSKEKALEIKSRLTSLSTTVIPFNLIQSSNADNDEEFSSEEWGEVKAEATKLLGINELDSPLNHLSYIRTRIAHGANRND